MVAEIKKVKILLGLIDSTVTVICCIGPEREKSESISK